ncbi:MAG: DUF1566 domain-containing protein [Bacteroides sp.]|nr:DUF1566 domain-containing protein [Bacteroides sp.]
MKTIRVFLVLAIFGLILDSCESDLWDKSQKKGCIMGTITFYNTESVVNAYVQLLSKDKNEIVYSGLINSRGNYKIDNVSPASYRFKVFKLGYIDTIFKGDVQIKSKASNNGSCCQLDWAVAKIPPRLNIVDDEGLKLDSLNFGANDDDISRSFCIFNNDSKTLNWKIETNAPWISSVSKKNGTMRPGGTQSVIVTIDRKKLSEGENKTSIHIISEESVKQLVVIAIGRKYQMPIVKMLSVTNLTDGSAVVHAAIISKGDPAYTERGFVYRQSSMPILNGICDNKTVPTTDDSLFHATISQLWYHSNLYVRAYAINRFDTVYSDNEVMFGGSPAEAQVEMLPYVEKNISERYIKVQANIVQPGNPEYTECGFVYGLNPNTTVNTSYKEVSIRPSEGVYSNTLTNLDIGKRYYVNAYVIQEDKASYGTEMEVDFSPVLPDITISVTDKLDELTILYADMSADGEPVYTEVGFLYGVLPYPTIENGTGTYAEAIEIGKGKYMTKLTSLLEGETYYACAYARNEYYIKYSDVISFKVDNRYYKSYREAGIMVQRSDIGTLSFPKAEEACRTSNMGGFNDWRMPTDKELQFLNDKSEELGNFSQNYYWSSTSCSITGEQENIGERQYKMLVRGFLGHTYCKNENEIHGVRAVRTINESGKNSKR